MAPWLSATELLAKGRPRGMNDVRLDSENNSDGISPTERQLLPLRPSERSILADQAADAATAMSGAVHEIRVTLKRATDVRPSAEQHPWLMVATAVAGRLRIDRIASLGA